MIGNATTQWMISCFAKEKCGKKKIYKTPLGLTQNDIKKILKWKPIRHKTRNKSRRERRRKRKNRTILTYGLWAIKLRQRMPTTCLLRTQTSNNYWLDACEIQHPLQLAYDDSDSYRHLLSVLLCMLTRKFW